MKFIRRFRPDLYALLVLLILPLILFAPVTLGNKTLIPTDNLFQWAPWQSYAADAQVEAPHNELVSDLLLENLAWKRFILQSIQEREIPLWNPYLFAGEPFLAAGQHSALYPFSLIFYVVPLPRAYGLFVVSQLFLAGAFMYLLARVLRLRRWGALLAAITYQLCGFLTVSVTFPMILAASAWLPFLLAMIELTVRQAPVRGQPSTLPWVTLGAAGLGIQLMAGHGENTYFSLLVMGLFAAWRLGGHYLSAIRAKQKPNARFFLRPAVLLLLMVALGVGLGAVQFLPFVELVQYNFREGTATLADILNWSFPVRRGITLLAPNFFGRPSQHSYLSLFDWQRHAVSINALGNPIQKIDWGIKNYVEGGIYLGILPLLLAALAVVNSLGRRRRRSETWFFALLSVASLAFIFPTGAYAIIHAIPIINQSHSPFRWVYPLSLSVAILAGQGMNDLETANGRFPRLLGWLAALSGAAGIAALVLARGLYGRIAPLVEKVFWGLARAPEAFPDAQAFFSYEFWQLLVASLALLAAGLVILLAVRRVRLWRPLAIVLVAADLLLAIWGFFPQADPELLDTPTQLIDFLQAQPGNWRLTTFNPHGDAPLHANTPWLYGLYDVRGYDSIIPLQYTQYMAAIEPQNELLYNRVQPIKQWESLNSPLLDLLNVRFIVTAETLDLPKLRLAWEGEGLRVYENLAAASRAFTLPLSATTLTDDPLATMLSVDPRNAVIVDSEDLPAAPQAGEFALGVPKTAEIVDYGSQELLIQATAAEPSWLVLADSYFPGWKAYRRPVGADKSEEEELTITRVNGNFRGVQLPAGEWTVRFKYSPMSFKLGLFISFTAAMTLVFSAGVWLWRRIYREEQSDTNVRRVAKNSIAPMALNLFNRSIDFAFAMLMLRILGAENAGKYSVAIIIAGWFEILSNFGLNTLLTREVSQDKSQANRYLVNTTLLRFGTSLVAAVPITLYILVLNAGSTPMASDTILAIVLFVLGMIPGGINTGLTALFFAYEKNEIPAAFTTVATIIRVALSTVVLLLGAGFVGLAAVSIAVNLITMVLLSWLAFRNFFVPHLETDWPLQRSMLSESFPLMLNHLLATIYFKVDVLLLERFAGTAQASGNTVVGWYSTAYKFVDAVNIIPSFFTMAIFPTMSRLAKDSRETMQRTYELAVKLLVLIALPLAVATTYLAPIMVRILGGAEYLPHGAIALQLLIWSIPIGWINSITNYVLIALGEQRRLTRAFIIGVGFNILANLIFLPRYSYPAAAIITLFSELLLLIAFYHYLRRSLGVVPWLRLLGRPFLAAALMMAAAAAAATIHWLAAVLAGVAVYGIVLLVVPPLTRAERDLLSTLLPARLRDRWPFPTWSQK